MPDKVKFIPPQGAQLPEGIEPGKPFSLTCDFVVEQNGEVCLVKFGDTDMPYDEKEEGYQKENKPDYGTLATNLMESREGGN